MTEPINTDYVCGKEEMASNELENAYVSDQQGNNEAVTKYLLFSIAWSLLAISQQLGYVNNAMEGH